MNPRRRAQISSRWIIGAAIGMAVIAGLAMLIFRFSSPVVTVTEAVEGPVVQAFYSTGTVQPVREFPIKSNVSGVLTEVRVDKGHRVKKGDALAIVSEPELKFMADKAKAEVVERE